VNTIVLPCDLHWDVTGITESDSSNTDRNPPASHAMQLCIVLKKAWWNLRCLPKRRRKSWETSQSWFLAL